MWLCTVKQNTEEMLKLPCKKYCYRYKYVDVARRYSDISPFYAGTTIFSNVYALMKMYALYKEKHNIKPSESLVEKGIYFDRKKTGNRGALIITHPGVFPKKEDVECFPHRDIAYELTKLWRDFYDANIKQE